MEATDLTSNEKRAHESDESFGAEEDDATYSPHTTDDHEEREPRAQRSLKTEDDVATPITKVAKLEALVEDDPWTPWASEAGLKAQAVSEFATFCKECPVLTDHFFEIDLLDIFLHKGKAPDDVITSCFGSDFPADSHLPLVDLAINYAELRTTPLRKRAEELNNRLPALLPNTLVDFKDEVGERIILHGLPPDQFTAMKLLFGDAEKFKEEAKLDDSKSGTVWYHGTHLGAAADIIYNGIHVKRGNLKRDFTDGSGFYVSEQFDHALLYAKHRTHNVQATRPVVLRFEVNLSEVCQVRAPGAPLLEEDKRLQVYDLRDDALDIWQQTVGYCRNGRIRNPDLKGWAQTHYAPFAAIWGPNPLLKDIPSDYSQIAQGNMKQLAIKSDDLAKKFSLSISHCFVEKQSSG